MRLVDCIALKSSVKRSDKWEENYTEFEAHGRMPSTGTKLYNCKQTQLSSGPSDFDAIIEKEIDTREHGVE